MRESTLKHLTIQIYILEAIIDYFQEYNPKS